MQMYEKISNNVQKSLQFHKMLLYLPLRYEEVESLVQDIDI